MRRFFALFLLSVTVLAAQGSDGELRLQVMDPSGLGVQATVELVSEAMQYRETFTTSDAGLLVVKRLPYGLYRVRIQQPGFADVSETIEVRSALPVERTIRLVLAPMSATVTVRAAETLIDPHQATAAQQISSSTIQSRMSSLPGRSLQDLVNSQPGWVYEGNGVLHPRGSEYQTQFIVDGIPLTDNRSPSFGPEIEADDVQSMGVYTAGFAAEYGRKLGGVVEINTLQEARQGFHGQAVLSGGSFGTAGSFVQAQYTGGKNTFGFSARGNMTDHYLNPVVPQNFTNSGTTGAFSVRYERDLTPNDTLTLIVRHGLSRFQIPNEQTQQAPHQNPLDPSQPLGSQLQNADNFETMGIVSYEHVFSGNFVADVHGMVRDGAHDLYSNPFSTPVIAFQRNWFREGYFKGSVTLQQGIHQWKAGVESDNTFLHENFSDIITDPSQFDPATPPNFAFSGRRPAIEQSAFVQDLIRLGNWTVSAGLRWDHYQLLVNQNAVSPRLSLARYFPSADLVLHVSYDRIFQTPSSDNLLLSSSPLVVSLNPAVLRLPIKPSHADFFEGGMTKALHGQWRFSANVFRRQFDNFADDDQLLSTAVSFPIAFRRGILYGADGKIELLNWRRFSGFATYSYIVGNVWLPVTGGLLLGDETAVAQLAGHFPDSQDQRNTARARVRYQIASRLWIAGGAEYGSGLPFQLQNAGNLLGQYGQAVLDRLNFNRGRIRPAFTVDVSAGAEIYKSDRLTLNLQADAENLTNLLDVIDFGGLFSGNAIGPPRSYYLRLTANF
jgi:TonB dependent receptor/TonB-dependent Receptor Plug Domain